MRQPGIVLNPHQRRHFEVLLARLEESLGKVEMLLGSPRATLPVLTVLIDDPPESFRERAVEVVRDLREQIVELARDLSVAPRTLSRSRAIAATLSAEAVRIEDSLSPQLRGYGDVHPSLSRELDPRLERIARALTALAAALRAAHSSLDTL